MGRGVRFVFAVTPQLTPKEFSLLEPALFNNPYFSYGLPDPKSANPFYPSGSAMINPFNACFAHVRASDAGAITDSQKDITWQRVKVFCDEARFRIRTSDAEGYYTAMLYAMFNVASVLIERMKKNFDVEEFSLLYRFVPKEHKDEFLPLFSLGTAMAFVLWR